MDLIRKYITEAKKDYIASSRGTMITIKNGYKNNSEEDLQAMYEKIGKMAQGSKIKIKSITIGL